MSVRGNASTALVEEIVRSFGEVHLRVLGTSMAPSVLPGDVVSVRFAKLDEISVGEIVLFSRRGRFFIHRVVSTCAASVMPCLITRGDRLGHDDPPVNLSEFLGRIVSIERGNRKVGITESGSIRLMARLLQSSDRATYLYVRLNASWRSLFLPRVKCQA
jgi:signal peptidase I